MSQCQKSKLNHYVWIVGTSWSLQVGHCGPGGRTELQIFWQGQALKVVNLSFIEYDLVISLKTSFSIQEKNIVNYWTCEDLVNFDVFSGAGSIYRAFSLSLKTQDHPCQIDKSKCFGLPPSNIFSWSFNDQVTVDTLRCILNLVTAVFSYSYHGFDIYIYQNLMYF